MLFALSKGTQKPWRVWGWVQRAQKSIFLFSSDFFELQRKQLFLHFLKALDLFTRTYEALKRYPCTPLVIALRRLIQGLHKFKANLCYIVRLSQKKIYIYINHLSLLVFFFLHILHFQLLKTFRYVASSAHAKNSFNKMRFNSFHVPVTMLEPRDESQ